jgi:hypothetical protein
VIQVGLSNPRCSLGNLGIIPNSIEKVVGFRERSYTLLDDISLGLKLNLGQVRLFNTLWLHADRKATTSVHCAGRSQFLQDLPSQIVMSSQSDEVGSIAALNCFVNCIQGLREVFGMIVIPGRELIEQKRTSLRCITSEERCLSRVGGFLL